jgi:lipopolysaccharide/colanic/teichoic acid biosynthesis glycosyltransferase
MYKHFIKPCSDFIIAFFLLIILSPIILLTTILLFLANNRNVFFLQKRPGLNCKPFKIVKFKTMKDAFDNEGIPLPDDVRLTKVGSFIRSASLDELLQLINVIKGEMSLVGPRPLLMQYLPKYSPKQLKRHNVKPGITGWAQINGRNSITWEQKFNFDIEYIDNMNFLFDLKILFLTFFKLFNTNIVNKDQNTTMEEFNP